MPAINGLISTQSCVSGGVHESSTGRQAKKVQHGATQPENMSIQTSDVSSPSATSASDVYRPKFSSPIPNRIFVGGLPSNTSEQEIKSFFTTYGVVKDVKIINDRAGVGKGYGFVTFEEKEIAEKILREEMENIFFKERKLNIGHAYRKHHQQQRTSPSNSSVFFTSGSVPYTYQNGMAVFSVPHASTPYAAPELTYPASSPFMGHYAVAYLPSQSNSPYPPAPYAAPAACLSATTHSPWSSQSTPRPLAAAAGPNWPLQPPLPQSQSNTPSNTSATNSPFCTPTQNGHFPVPLLYSSDLAGLVNGTPPMNTDCNQSTSDYSTDHSFADLSFSNGSLESDSPYLARPSLGVYYPHSHCHHYVSPAMPFGHYPSPMQTFRPQPMGASLITSPPPPVSRLQASTGLEGSCTTESQRFQTFGSFPQTYTLASRSGYAPSSPIHGQVPASDMESKVATGAYKSEAVEAR